MLKRFRLISGLLLLLSSGLGAQEHYDSLVTGEFRHIALPDWVKELESQTKLRFFYDTTQADSVFITVSASRTPLRKVLAAGLENTGFHYSIVNDRYVFLSRGVAISNRLPAHFFEAEPGHADSAALAIDTAALDLYARDEARKRSREAEDKLFIVGERPRRGARGEVVLGGYIRNASNGEPVVGASVQVQNSSIGTSTDQYGYYAVSLPRGRYIISIQGIGMRDAHRVVQLQGEGKLDIDLIEQVVSLKEVIVSARKTANVRKVQMGVQQLNIRTIKQSPALFGESDVLRAVQTLPGVKTVGEASTGLNVRGGSADQNLVLFNGATIYNPSHFFGFFSAFNPEVISDIELYKSSLPAYYGGRLSSLLDISSREGNKKELKGSAGIGVLTSRFNLEGPLVKNKTSFILGARGTYADWLLNLLPDEYKKSKGSFYDVNLNISHTLNNKNSLFLTGYFSSDGFRLNSDTSYNYRNNNVVLRWKHSFSSKFNAVISGGYDQYNYSIRSDEIKINGFALKFDIRQWHAGARFTYYLNSQHTLDFGFNSIRYQLHPGSYTPLGSTSLVTPDIVEAEQALENAFFLSDRFNVTRDLSLEAGIRYSLYSYLGPQSVNRYAPNLPKSEDSQVGTDQYGSGKFIDTYGGPEFRLSARYGLTGTASVKASVNSTRQYIHVLSNTTAISPTDIWKLSDPNIRPQYGVHYSLGFYKNLKGNTIETSVEVYYKKIRDYLDYKSGAQLLLNHHIETDVINTRGKSYGVELMVRKTAGKLNGWISYAWSRVFLKMDDPQAGEVINNGNFYPAIYDKPHDITVVSNFRFSHRFSVSVNATYSTGRPITLPTGTYYYYGSRRVSYSERNAGRIPDYFRTDFSMNIEGNHKVHQKTHNSWTLGLYNVTGRKNAYSVYFISENGQVNGYKLSIFGTILPYINYNIRF